jgi:RecB family endonuclease NucS
LRERSDLQEWVVAHPEIIGDGVLVVTFEFDHWQAFSGARERDRLDVLGLGADGQLVVAELKRDRAPDTVEMQAIKRGLGVGLTALSDGSGLRLYGALLVGP